MAQLGECRPNIQKAWALWKPGAAAHTCDIRIQEVEAGGPEVQSHPQLRSQLEASLGSMRPPSQTNKSLNNNKITGNSLACG